MDLDTILGLLFFVFFVVLPLFSRGAKGRKGRPGQGQQQGRGTAAGGTGRSAAGSPTASTTQDTPSVTLAEIRRRVEEAQKREAERARMAGQGRGRPSASTQRPGSLVGSDPFEGALVSVPERRLDDLGERRPTGLGPEGRPGQEGLPPGTGRAPASGLGREATPSRGTSGPIGREGISGRSGDRYVIGREGTPGRSGDRYVIGREGTASGARLDSGSPIGREGLGGHEGAFSSPGRSGSLGREGGRQIVSPTVVPSTRAARRIARAAQAEIGSEGRGDGGRPGSARSTARLGAAAALQTDKAGIMQGLIWHEILSPPLSLRRRRER